MGNILCCDSSSYEVEDYVNSIFQCNKFTLKFLNNNRLLNKLVDVRINQELHKKYVEEKVIPLFYEKTENPFEKYHLELFNHILFFLKEKNNMYDVLLYFYPFIDHTDENVAKTFFSFVKYIYGKTTLKNVIDLLNRYFKFITREINNVVISVEGSTKISKALRENNESVFTDENINNFIAIKMFNILKKYGDNEIIGSEEFERTMNKVNLGSFAKIRQSFLSQFGQK